MTPKPLRLRPAAIADLDAIADHYAEKAGPAVAERFAIAVERALGHVALHPGTGSPRYGRDTDLPVRFWPLRRFPYLVFYAEEDGAIDVWRVLHAHRDIPATLMEADAGSSEQA